MENRRWISKLIEVIDELSSQEFQERVWLNGLGHEVSSYEEAINRLFDDLEFSRLIDIEWRQAGLGEKTALVLRDFRDKLIEFNKNIPEIPHPKDILGHPSWPNIRASAFQAARILEADAGVLGTHS